MVLSSWHITPTGACLLVFISDSMDVQTTLSSTTGLLQKSWLSSTIYVPVAVIVICQVYLALLPYVYINGADGVFRISARKGEAP